MLPSVNPGAQLFLADVSRLQEQISTASQQLSSGLKIRQPSDAPEDMVTLMRVRADIDRNQQVASNLATVKSETDSAEQALETATQLMDTAVSLASQGANTTSTPAANQALAQQTQGILEQLVGLSNTAVQGRYVFSGDQPDSPSYQVNLGNANGVDRLITPAATRQVTDSS